MQDLLQSPNLNQWLGTLGASVSIYAAWKFSSAFVSKRKRQKAIDLKWSNRAEQIQRLKKHLEELGSDPTIDKLWKEILKKSFEELRDELKNGGLQVIDVLRAYQWAALQSNQTRNNVVWFLEEAEARAQELDLVPLEQRGPLFGIPISIKECYKVKGCDSTAGKEKINRNNF